jgi:tetratricopeptide (TPR) repeat protein
MSRFVNLEFGVPADNHSQRQEAANDEAACLEAAGGAFAEGQFAQALRWYAKVLEYNPANTAAWTGQVRMLIELGEFREAKLWADKAIEQFPRHGELLAAKAVALARSGDLGAAMAFSDAALQEADTPYLWLARGDVLLARKEKRADYCFTKVLAMAPRDWIWPWLISRVHCFYERFSLALKYISEALALEAGHAVVWAQMGRCQLALGLAAAAQNSFEQARELKVDCPGVDQAIEQLGQQTPWSHLAGLWRRWFGR